MPDVMRVETEHGEATLIIACGVVEHASPCMVWALGMPLATLLQYIARHDLCAVWVRWICGPKSKHGIGGYRLVAV